MKPQANHLTAEATGPAFARALAFAAAPTERRNTIPVLSMVKISFEGAQGTISGTDLYIEASSAFDLIEPILQPFTVVLRPGILASLARYANAISFTREGDLITITADDVEARLRETCPATDVPNFATKAFAIAESISAPLLHTALHSTRPCLSTEETRYYLNGHFFTRRDGHLTVVTTDGHRLARYETGAAWGLPDAILPKKSAAILAQQISKARGDIVVTSYTSNDPDTLTRDTQTLHFAGEGWTLKTKVIDGAYPDYTRVIPKADTTLRATVNMEAIRRFPNLLGDRAQALKFDLDKARLIITGDDANTISMPLQGSGHGSFGFNLKYVKDFAQRADEIRIEGSGSGDPFRILTSDPNLLQVLMPIMF